MNRAVGLLLFALVASIGCGDDDDNNDGGDVDDAGSQQDSSLFDGASPLTWVDFATSGCDVGQGVCSGAAPLRVRFVALAPAPLVAYLWDFGDGSEPDTREAPEHVFYEPGTYDVSLAAGGPGGTAQKARAAFVVVSAADLGAPCEDQATCAESLMCLCPAGVCDGPLRDGLCTAQCASEGDCPQGSVCVDLAPAGSEGDAPFRESLCVADCSGDALCPSGSCLSLPSVTRDTWIPGCFPAGVLLPEGASCKDGDAVARDAACLGGECTDLGLRGLCASSCEAASCPPHAACVSFGNGQKRCLTDCARAGCPSDPRLACQAPGGSGAFGFQVAGHASVAGYCAPRRCSGPSDDGCGPAATCVELSGAFFCR